MMLLLWLLLLLLLLSCRWIGIIHMNEMERVNEQTYSSRKLGRHRKKNTTIHAALRAHTHTPHITIHTYIHMLNFPIANAFPLDFSIIDSLSFSQTHFLPFIRELHLSFLRYCSLSIACLYIHMYICEHIFVPQGCYCFYYHFFFGFSVRFCVWFWGYSFYSQDATMFHFSPHFLYRCFFFPPLRLSILFSLVCSTFHIYVFIYMCWKVAHWCFLTFVTLQIINVDESILYQYQINHLKLYKCSKLNEM